MIRLGERMKKTAAYYVEYRVVKSYIRRQAVRLTPDNLGYNETRIATVSNTITREDIRPVEKIIPLNFTKDSKIYLRAADYQFRTQHLFEVCDAELIGPDAVAISRPGRIVLDAIDFSTDRLIPAIQRSVRINPIGTALRIIPLSLARKHSTEKTFNTVCSLHTGWNNYYHWFTEHLLKLRGVEIYRQKYGVKPLLLIPPDPEEYVTKSLEVMGYSEGEYCEWNFFSAHVKHLVIPSYPELTSSAVSWLRKRMLGHITRTNIRPHKRIYISRNDSHKRRVVNERELVRMLTSFGFEKFLLSQMSVEDQLKLFSEAEIVVGPHGAGLTNLLWGKNISVIELLGYYIRPHYARLCNSVGHKYHCVRCSQVDKSYNSDIFADIESVKLELVSIINNK
jgi:hypothetical protein